MQDVEGLHGVKHPVPLVLSEDRVVRLVVPLRGHRGKDFRNGKKKKKNGAKDAAWKTLQSLQRLTWVRFALKGLGSQATRVPELYRELDRNRCASEAITWREKQ